MEIFENFADPSGPLAFLTRFAHVLAGVADPVQSGTVSPHSASPGASAATVVVVVSATDVVVSAGASVSSAAVSSPPSSLQPAARRATTATPSSQRPHRGP